MSKASKVNESVCVKSSSAQTAAKITSSCDNKKLANVTPKMSLSNSKIHNEVNKEPRLFPGSASQCSASITKSIELNSRVTCGAVKCSSASATPIMARLSTSNKYDNVGFISPCKSKKGKELLDIFPSSVNNSRWWEVLLPLKREPNEGRWNGQSQNASKENSLVKEPKKNCYNDSPSKFDALKPKVTDSLKTPACK